IDQTAVGFRKSDKQLREAVDQTLATFKKDGRLTQIENKWFSK
ncbi:MAG: transporter substrate-binding domain-containing protein, partial [Leuconostoc lactis]